MHKNTRRYPVRRLSICLLMFMMVSACHREEKPPIPREQMAQIMIDIHLSEAYSGLLSKDSAQAAIKVKNLDSLAVYYKEVLDKHHLSISTFDSAFKWYRFHPALMDSVYERVVQHFDSLQMMK